MIEAQGHHLAMNTRTPVPEFAIEIRVRQVVVRGPQLGQVRLFDSQCVQTRHPVTAHPVVAHQHFHAVLQLGHVAELILKGIRLGRGNFASRRIENAKRFEGRPEFRRHTLRRR